VELLEKKSLFLSRLAAKVYGDLMVILLPQGFVNLGLWSVVRRKFCARKTIAIVLRSTGERYLQPLCIASGCYPNDVSLYVWKRIARKIPARLTENLFLVEYLEARDFLACSDVLERFMEERSTKLVYALKTEECRTWFKEQIYLAYYHSLCTQKKSAEELSKGEEWARSSRT